MWRLDALQDEERLRAAWSRAEPFPHLVIDDFVGAEKLPELLTILEEEPVETYVADIYRFDASAPEPKTEALKALRAELADVVAPSLSRITGKTLRRADLRAYAYRPGHYLLPHADHQANVGRALAFAYYVPSPEPPAGGELELYRCAVDGEGTIAKTESAVVIEPKADRIALFDVSDVSLHQVREVLSGLRISLSGWFYP